MKNIILIFFICSTSLFAITKSEKYTFIKTNKLISQGYYKKAIKILNPVILEFNKNDNLLYLKGKALKELGELEQATLVLKKVLSINQDNIFARKLIDEIALIENAKQNNVVQATLEWLSDKGIDFLFIFFGILGGELLLKELAECEKKSNNNAIKRYVDSLIDNALYRKHISIKCFFIDSLILLTTSIALVVVILLVEVLLNLQYLDDMTYDTMWIHVFIIFSCITLVQILIKVFEKEEQLKVCDISDSLLEYLHNDELKLLRYQFKVLELLDNAKYKYILDDIFNNILIDSDKEMLFNIYNHQKKIKNKEKE